LDISDLAPISGPRQTRNGDRATAPARPSRISLRATWNPRRANMFDSPSMTRHIRLQSGARRADRVRAVPAGSGPDQRGRPTRPSRAQKRRPRRFL